MQMAKSTDKFGTGPSSRYNNGRWMPPIPNLMLQTNEQTENNQLLL